MFKGQYEQAWNCFVKLNQSIFLCDVCGFTPTPLCATKVFIMYCKKEKKTEKNKKEAEEKFVKGENEKQRGEGG